MEERTIRMMKEPTMEARIGKGRQVRYKVKRQERSSYLYLFAGFRMKNGASSLYTIYLCKIYIQIYDKRGTYMV